MTYKWINLLPDTLDVFSHKSPHPGSKQEDVFQQSLEGNKMAMRYRVSSLSRLFFLITYFAAVTLGVHATALAQLAAENAKLDRAHPLSREAQEAINLQRVQTVPYWTSFYRLPNSTDLVPYSMVGRAPWGGQTTSIRTVLLPVSFVFSDTPNGTVDVSPIVDRTLDSPDFGSFQYTSSEKPTQFADAVQRAELWQFAKSNAWHTMLERPRVLPAVKIQVPTSGGLLGTEGGPPHGYVSEDFMTSQIKTILQLEPVKSDELVIILTHNTTFCEGPIPDSCVEGGWHVAYEKGDRTDNSTLQIQTYVVASWLDKEVSRIIANTIHLPAYESTVDVLPLSHEISEWMNDPFNNNHVPNWLSPNFPIPNSPLACNYETGNFETGDAVEFLNDSWYPITMNDFTYHVQNEALLQWFISEKPSSAIDGVYSYPDTNTLTKFPEPCSPPAQ